jgi:ribosomal protein S18 acetylase RimI-like enzyme
MPDYVTVSNEEEYKSAALLFSEYANCLGIDLSFQNFEEELQNLKTMYGPPKGTIILSRYNGEYIACIAVRPIDDSTAELKRMYVKPSFQRNGIGEKLLSLALIFSQQKGYAKIRLDTLNTMIPANNLYKKNGFVEIPSYYFNPETTAVFFEKKL